MPNRGPFLCGEITAGISLARLAAILQSGGMPARVRESSHYQGGRYVRVDDDGDFTIEQVARGHFLVQATSDSTQRLEETSGAISNALSIHNLRHRFELYDAAQLMTQYLHHLWPAEANNG